LRNYIAFFFLLDGFLNVDPIFPQGVVASTRATSYYGKGNLLYVLLKRIDVAFRFKHVVCRLRESKV